MKLTLTFEDIEPADAKHLIRMAEVYDLTAESDTMANYLHSILFALECLHDYGDEVPESISALFHSARETLLQACRQLDNRPKATHETI